MTTPTDRDDSALLRSSSQEWPRRWSRAAFAGGILLCTALAVWMVWPAFLPGRIVNLDAPRHLLRTQVMVTQFLPSGHVDGWSPWWYLGAQLFLFQSYGYFFLIGATTLLLSSYAHLLTIDPIFKLYYVLPFVLLAPVTALLARRLGVSGRGAIAAALASIIFTSPLGYGVQGIFGVGLLLQGAGVIGFALAWPEILAVLMTPERSPWRVVLIVTAVLLCHFITGAYTLAAAGGVAAGLALSSRTPRPLLRYALIATLVILLAGHSLFPSLELHALAGGGVGWGEDRDRFYRLLAGTLFGARTLAIPALAAAAWAALRGKRALSISAMVFFATALAGGANEQPWMPQRLEALIQTLLRPRALPYAALFQAVFAGVAADLALAAVARVATRLGRARPQRWVDVATPVVLVAVLLAGWEDFASQRHFVRTESALAASDHRVYTKLVEWLRENVARPAVLAVPRTLLPRSAIGARSVISLLNIDTGLYTLLGDQAELSRTSHRGGRVDLDHVNVRAAQNANILRSAGVSYLIVSRPAVRRGLVGSPDFELVFQYEQPLPARRRKRLRSEKPGIPLGVAVYRLRGGGQRLHGAGLSATITRRAPEHLAWRVRMDPARQSSNATIALNWHPGWTASVDGKPIATRCSPTRRVSLTVPAGTTQVALDFERTPRETLWNALSLVTLVFVLARWWRAARVGRPREDPDA